jgi:hypothetical protein
MGIQGLGSREKLALLGHRGDVLISLDEAHDPTRELTARERGLIHQYEHVKRIPVTPSCPRHESKIVRKRHAGG